MDIETVYLFLGVFVLSAAMLLVLQRLFKNKSYEEVVAEHRQQNHALYGNQQKPKVKDKKQKKALKKSKEKKSQDESESAVDSSEQPEMPEEVSTSSKLEAPSPAPEVQKPHAHVEFQEATTVIEEPIKETKRKQRRESMKPILVNRDSSSELIKDVIEVPLANHFEESHPKDEFELQSAQNAHSHQVKEELKNEKKKKQQVADKKSKHQANEIISKIEKPVEKAVEKPVQKAQIKPAKVVEEKPVEVVKEVVAPVPNGLTAVPVKDKKKKKSELNALTQNSDKLGINLAQLITLIRKTDMSKQDVQTLIDVLLNKQHDAPTFINEWSEGKGDPMQKLKKQLAEKTQIATELQDTLTGVQNKLKDVRADHLAERSQLMHNLREYQERVNAMMMEKNALEQQKRTMAAKCHQLEESLNEEASKTRHILEEYQHLCLQRSQMDVTMGKLADADMAVESLKEQLASVSEQRNHDQQAYIALSTKFKEESDKKDIYIRDVVTMKNSLESQMKNITMDNEKMGMELKILHEKMRGSEMNNQGLQKQVEDASKEVTKSKNDLRQVRKDAHVLQEQLSRYYEENTKLQEECAKLNNMHSMTVQEKHKLQEEFQKLQDSKTNGSIEMDKQHQVLINQLNTEIKNMRNQLDQNDESHKTKYDALKKQCDVEMDELRNKNNELRKKNWKVMEALNAAEARVKPSPVVDNEKLVTQIRTEERDVRTKFIKRLFPSIEVSSSLAGKDWEDAIEEAVRTHIKQNTPPPVIQTVEVEVRTPVDDTELVRLRTKVADYEKIIGETEGILFKLQTHVEEEQTRWRRELKSKEDSIASLNEQLQIKEEQLIYSACLNEAITNSCTTNGPILRCVTKFEPSTESSAASSVADSSEKKGKKKKKKKNKENSSTQH